MLEVFTFFHDEGGPCERMLRVSQDDDDGVIRVDDDPIRRTAPLGVLSGAVVGVVTALPSG
ncbi:MAG TPA: hypothetical protein VNY55_02415 [Mycobacterium sp.]|nr:hypothetical protein [Mycobacterium sp.]